MPERAPIVGSLVRAVWQDARYALRLLGRNPGFAAVAVLTLALGIGVNTATFSVVNSVVLRPLPYDRPHELIRIFSTWIDFPRGSVSVPEYLDYDETVRSLDGLAAYSLGEVDMIVGDSPLGLRRASVSASLLPLLGVEPAIGRGFLDTEGRPGGDRVALLSHGLWERAFGGEPGVIGSSVRMAGEPFRIVGVMAPGFAFPEAAIDVWLPLRLDPARARGAHSLRVVARLAAGVSIEAAQVEMDGMAVQYARDYPTNYPEGSGFGIVLTSLHGEMVGDAGPMLLMLLGAVGLVLLIACVNVANLLLVRATRREQEMAVRAALGASRGRLARQLLTESVLFAVLGSAGGVALGVWGVKLLVALQPGNLPRADELSRIGLDGRVLLFTMAATLVAVLLSGLAPAIRAWTKTDPAALKDGRRATPGRHRLQQLLAVGEVALTVVLLIGAGLMIQSLWRLERVEPGFAAERVLSMRVSLPRVRYPEPGQSVDFFRLLRDNLAQLSGVEAVGAVSNPPFSGWYNDNSLAIEGRPPAVPGLYPFEELRSVTPGYFRALDIPLVRGRVFNDRDVADNEHVVIVSQSFADKHWDDADPLGRRVKNGGLESDAPWARIVGVVGDVKHGGFREDVRPTWYVPHTQRPQRTLTVMVRTASAPAGVFDVVRQEVSRIDPELPVFDLGTLRQVVADSTAQPRFTVLVLTIFAGLAIALAAIGLYGVIAYTTAQRTHEIGIRLALGAERRDIFRTIVGGGMGLTLVGLTVGLLGALLATRLIDSLLFGIEPTDSATFGAVAVLLAAVSLAACAIPARRAMRVDPVETLRAE